MKIQCLLDAGKLRRIDSLIH